MGIDNRFVIIMIQRYVERRFLANRTPAMQVFQWIWRNISAHFHCNDVEQHSGYYSIKILFIIVNCQYCRLCLFSYWYGLTICTMIHIVSVLLYHDTYCIDLKIKVYSPSILSWLIHYVNMWLIWLDWFIIIIFTMIFYKRQIVIMAS